ncbi:MAG: hypothetical protein KAS87_04170 [Candidatus Omnitrophica bacterium]|nr:hypothetical protein [Candidatus Omnitrophota bacterium]
MNYAQVALNLPVDKLFDYAIPEHLREEVKVGKRVWVEFRNRKAVAYIVKLLEESRLKKVKEIKKVIDEQSIISSFSLLLSKWLSKYYFCSWGEAIALTLPSPLRKGQRRTNPSPPTPLPCRNWKWVGAKENLDLNPDLDPKQSLSADKIIEAIKQNDFQPSFIYDNAEERIKIYLRLSEYVLSQNKGVIVLVPQISLASKLIAGFISHFGKIIAQCHSRLSSRQQFQEWQRIEEGKAKIIIGTRSAVFSSLKNLGLIIVDEEQSNSYKEENMPRYNAREVAVKKAEIEKATIVLGTSVPSLQTYHKAKLQEYKLLQTKEKKEILKTRIIERRKEDPSISPFLKMRIEEYLQKKKRVVLYTRLGGQRIIKGENFSDLGLIGVISADSILNLPNFLAGERTFQLLSQIGIEAKKTKAEFVIQTYNATHFSIVAAAKEDWEGFYEKEIAYRQELDYPPFTHFINIILRNKNEENLKKEIGDLSEQLKNKFGETRVLGPIALKSFKAKPSIYCRYIILKTKDILKTNPVLKEVLVNFSRVIIDVDPLFFF